MPIDRQEQQQPEITYTYTETTITQPIQPKQPNWENYVEGTQSSVFDQNRGLNSSVDQNSNPFSSSSTQQPTGYTSTNVGSQNLGKTDSDFHSSPRVNVAPSFIPSNDLGSNLDRDRSGSDLRSNQGSSSNQGSNFNSGSNNNNNNNSSNDQDNTVSHMGSTGITTPRTNISSEPIAKPISQTFDPINVPFDPSIPQGIDAAADQRARGFYSGVDAKTNALGEIAGGKLLKGLNHVDRKSDSDLNRDSNSSNSNSNSNSNNDRDRSNDRDRTEDQSRSKDSHSGNTGAHDSNAQPHREGAYMPETTQHQEGGKSQDAHKEKKPLPERVADWVQNKMHPDKSGKADDMEERRNEVEDINNNNNTSSRGTDSSSNQGQQGQSGTTHHEQNGNNASAHQA